MRPRSPIDLLIDKACGIDPADFVTMRCPTCNKEQRARRDDTDPPGTEVVDYTCPACRTDSDEVAYYDGEGDQIPFP